VLNNLQITFNSTSAQDNKSFVRILVPKNSTLLSAKGFADIEQKRSEAIGLNTDSDLQKWDISFEEIDSVKVRSQLDKQEFTGWVNIPSGRSVVLSLSYVVSIDARDHYSILIQPQAGSQLLTFKQNVNYQDKKVKWNNSLYRTQDGLLTLEAVISQDQKFDILFHR
jgi:hypothetical protein